MSFFRHFHMHVASQKTLICTSDSHSSYISFVCASYFFLNISHSSLPPFSPQHTSTLLLHCKFEIKASSLNRVEHTRVPPWDPSWPEGSELALVCVMLVWFQHSSQNNLYFIQIILSLINQIYIKKNIKTWSTFHPISHPSPTRETRAPPPQGGRPS